MLKMEENVKNAHNCDKKQICFCGNIVLLFNC